MSECIVNIHSSVSDLIITLVNQCNVAFEVYNAITFYDVSVTIIHKLQ